jgi:hypothetical protein
VGDLPAIPTDTPEGIRIHAIAETIRVLDEHMPSGGTGLELQNEDVRFVAARLGVPELFIESCMHVDNNSHEEHLEDYVAWRHQIAGKAVA